MSSHRTIDELAREAAAVTREAAERRVGPSADVEELAARLRPRRTLRVAAAALAVALGVVTVGTLANERLDPAIPVILDADDREVVEDASPPPAVIRHGAWEWDWALSLVTDPEVFAGHDAGGHQPGASPGQPQASHGPDAAPPTRNRVTSRRRRDLAVNSAALQQTGALLSRVRAALRGR